MLQTILLVAMILISVAMIAIVLLQKSEGGALGMGGGPSGFMTARGAGNLLTKATWILGGLFFLCAIGLTIAGNVERGSRSIIDADAVGSIAIGEGTPATGTAPVTAPTTAPAAPTAPSLDDLEASLPSAASATPAPAQPAPVN